MLDSLKSRGPLIEDYYFTRPARGTPRRASPSGTVPTARRAAAPAAIKLRSRPLAIVARMLWLSRPPAPWLELFAERPPVQRSST